MNTKQALSALLTLCMAIACSGNDSSNGDHLGHDDVGTGTAGSTGDGDDQGQTAGDGDGDSGRGVTPLDPSDDPLTIETSTGGNGSGGNGLGGASMGGASSVGFPTIPDYISCTTDDDCPNSIAWECVTQLSLSHEDPGGVQSLLVSDLDPSLTGVCTRDCAQDATACDDLNLDELEGTAPFTCQVVWTGESPYVDDQLFPFDDQLSPTAMNEGVAFAAVCRPPFELNQQRSVTFCGACSETSDCASGDVCWDPLSEGTDPGNGAGICSEPCVEATDCALGFTCSSVGDDGNFCLPLEATCGSCADRDGDERGAGYCAEEGTDCDDTNGDAYWDEDDENHPFPAFCGDFDYNCNGKSDQNEVLDPNENGLAWGALHCGACGSACGTDTPELVQNGSLTCVPNGNNGICIASCADVEEHADCDGDIYNGCETSVSGSVYWPDEDSDSFGDANATGVFPCGEPPPPGWVTNDSDCDDSTTVNAAAIFPGATEVCDNIDNDCDMQTDEGLSLVPHAPDLDQDGQGDVSAATIDLCEWMGAGQDPRGYSDEIDDCDDTRGDVYLGAAEACESLTDPSLLVDNDCDSNPNEGSNAVNYHLDADGDGTREGPGTNFLPPFTITACTAPTASYVRWGDLVPSRRTGDCDDSDDRIFPGNPDICDGLDNDCDDDTVDGEGHTNWGDSCDVVENPDNYCDDHGTLTACGTSAVTGEAEPVCVAASPAQSTDLPGDGYDQDCDGFPHDVEKSVYVIPGSADGGNGSQARPFNNLDSALSAVAANSPKNTIVLGVESGSSVGYTFDDTINLVPGTHLVGGYRAQSTDQTNYTDWEFTGTPTPITRNWEVVNGSVVVVEARNASLQTVLANVELVTAAPPASPALAPGEDGASVFGLVSINSGGLTLFDVEVSLGGGQDGGAATSVGADGANGANGVNTVGGVNTCALPQNGSANFDVSAGDILQSGQGMNPGSNGWPAAGYVGGHARYADSADLNSYSFRAGDRGRLAQLNGGFHWVRSSTQPTRGLPGSGGGGAWFLANPFTNGGGGGAGGCGGEPGANGGNGSILVGILIAGADVDLTGVAQITTGNAGVGGAATPGGDGGDGGAGYSGSGYFAGGNGSGGLGGGGGGGGHGGHNIGVLSLGASGNSCSASVQTVLGCSGAPGSRGATGSPGSRSASSAPSVSNGASGRWGWLAACFDGNACNNSNQCGSDAVCAQISPIGANVCVPDRDSVGNLTCN